MPPVCLQHRRRDGNSNESPEAGHEEGRAVAFSKVLNLAYLADADGREADGRPGEEAEQDGKDDDARLISVCRLPQPEDKGRAGQRRDAHGVEHPESVSSVARQRATRYGAGIDKDIEQVGVARRHACIYGVRAYISIRYEDGKLNQKHAHGCNGKVDIGEGLEINRRTRRLVRRKTFAETGAGHAEMRGTDKCHDSDSPREAYLGR